MTRLGAINIIRGCSRLLITQLSKSIYIDHLKRFTRHLGSADWNISGYIHSALLSERPFLFLINESGEPVPLDPKNLKEYRQKIIPSPLNVGRHILRSALTGNLPSELINAMMAHALVGFGPMSKRSGLVFAHHKKTRKAITSLMEKYGATPLGSVDAFDNLPPVHIKRKKGKKVKEEPAQPTLEKKEFGREKRSNTRAKRFKKIVHDFQDFIQSQCFDSENIEATEDYNAAVDLIDEYIDDFTNTDGRYVLKLKFSKVAKKILDANRSIRASLPEVPKKIIFDETFRTEDWFNRARYLSKFHKKFERKINNLKSKPVESLMDLIGLILYSAITRGGLCNATMVWHLAIKLGKRGKILERREDGICIILYSKSSTGASNYRAEKGGANKITRWLPDTFTLGLITRLIKRQEFLKAKALETTAFSIIERALFSTVSRTSIVKLEHLTSVGFWIGETRGDIEVSEALQMLAMNHFDHFCMDEKSWINLYSKPAADIQSNNIRIVKMEQEPEKITKDLDGVLSHFFEDLLSPAINLKRDGGSKIT